MRVTTRRAACNFYKPRGKLIQGWPHWQDRLVVERPDFFKFTTSYAALAREMHLSSFAKRHAAKTQATQPTESLQ